VGPRSGGEAEKFGNRYEGVWTVRRLLDVMAGRAESILVEDFGDLAKGVEFTFRGRSGPVQVHQVKRQLARQSGWTLKALDRVGVLAAAAHHVRDGRAFHFVSTIPAPDLNELSDRARRSDDLGAFVRGQLDGKGVRADFDHLCGVCGSPQETWEVLRGTFVQWPDEREVRDTNAALAGLLVEGAPALPAAVSLGDLIEHALGVTLTASSIAQRLAEYELRPADPIRAPQLGEAGRDATAQWLTSVRSELLHPVIDRDESDELVARLEGDARLALVAGLAGAGKSGVLYQAVERLQRTWPVLAVRLDRRDAFNTALQLGQQLDLPVSPTIALAAATADGPCLLVIDQLDAVSLASGRMPAAFDAIAELIRQARAFPQMRVLMACRRFDLDNDARLSGLVAEARGDALMEIHPLRPEQVVASVRAMGADPARLSEEQLNLLRTPLNLVLFRAFADEDAAPRFRTTKDLMAGFWDRKRRDCDEHAGRPVRFAAVIGRLVDEMSERQRLAVPVAVLDADELARDADVLRSAHVLAPSPTPVAFFHEAFFDYAFARRWSARNDTLVGFLLDGHQELFRRGQVRQVLLYLRDEDPQRFVAETESVLRDARVRFHIKAVVLGVLRSLPDPTEQEWQLVSRLIDAGLPLEPRIYLAIQTEAWFERLDEEGVLESWLSGDSADRQGRALETMRAAAKDAPASVARLLEADVQRTGFASRFRWLALWLQFARERRLFDLLLRTVRNGDWNANAEDLWMVSHSLGDGQPTWAAELVQAWLGQRASVGAPDEAGPIAALEGDDDHSASEIVRAAARGAPQEFLERLLPQMLAVMASTEYGRPGMPLQDRHFASRQWGGDHYRLGDVLLFSAAEAIEQLATSKPDSLRGQLEQLAADRHDAAQWLLYHGLTAAGEKYAEWAGQILSEGPHRLYSGYNDDAFWTTRQLLQAVGAHFDDRVFALIQAAILTLRPEWERPARPLAQFTLLSALPEDRLSQTAHRRLGELRRLFGCEQPSEPTGVVCGSFEAPVAESAAELMTDDQWLAAITRHSETHAENWETFTGGAFQQSQVLGAQAKRDPGRFARFGLRLNEQHNAHYLTAILQALGQTDEAFEPRVAYDLVRHAAGLDQNDLDRWVGMALGRVLDSDVPDDIIATVLDLALHAADPTADVWLRTSAQGVLYGGDPFGAGINSARGQSAIVLGDLLVTDLDGHRTALVADSLAELASDSIVAVRACVAHVMSACLRHAHAAVVTSLPTLVAGDDRLLATDPTERLIAFVSFSDLAIAEQITRRMLGSEYPKVREAGGRLAALLGLQTTPQLLDDAVASPHASIRRGAATVCAQRLPYAQAAGDALQRFFNDPDPDVRKAAAAVAGRLRDSDLRPHEGLLGALIASVAFVDARAQLLITLDRATSPIGSLALATAERFLAEHSDESAPIATAAGGNAREVAQLILRAYAQEAEPDGQRRALDLIDKLLRAGAWGVDEVITDAER
jgi:hypothetical protein